ncbi:MAG: hypothetical protein WBY53_00090 [Acidobacteriaceae bacterium]
MTLRPRHYILLAVILGLFVYRIILHREHENNLRSLSTAPAPVLTMNPRANTPAWAAYDTLAGDRDAPTSVYKPAFDDLQKLLPQDPNQKDGHIEDIKGCLTWLEFYRQGAAQTNPDQSMHARAARHIDDCVKYHQSTAE